MAHGILQQTYSLLPPLMQDATLTVFGLRNALRPHRCARIVRHYSASEHWSAEQQLDYVAGRLRMLLNHAFRFVPFYRQFSPLLRDIGAPSEEVVALLTRLPRVTRQEILADPVAFLSTQFTRQSLVRCLTSGTTGTPFAAWITPRVVKIYDGLGWRRTLWAGYKTGDWMARLVGDPVMPLRISQPKRPWRLSYSDRRIYFSSYHLNADTADQIVKCLNRRRPAFIMGYPSSLHSLVQLASTTGLAATWSPKAILYSSEPMYQLQRDQIEPFFRAPARGLYGNAERLVSAVDCEFGTAHLNLIDGYIEGQFERQPGHEPALVTGLLNLAMPLIRYELGDTIRLRPNAICACKRTLPILEPIVTKAEDTLLTTSGRQISPSVLTWAFKDVQGIRRSQIIQLDAHRVEVLVEADSASLARIRQTLLPRLQEITFGEFELHVTETKAISMTGAGKTRFVVNRLLSTELKRKQTET